MGVLRGRQPARPRRDPAAAAPPTLGESRFGPPPLEHWPKWVGPAHLLILLAAPRARHSGWAARAALAIAQRLGESHAQTVLVEATPGRFELGSSLGAGDLEGLADALLFGASLSHVSQEVPGASFRFIGPGLVGPEPDALLTSPHWEAVLGQARRRDMRILAYVDAEAPGVAELAGLADGALLLAEPGAVVGMLTHLPHSLPNLVLTAPPEEPVEAATVEPSASEVEPAEAEWIEAAAADEQAGASAQTATAPVEEHEASAEIPSAAVGEGATDEPLAAPGVEAPEPEPSEDPALGPPKARGMSLTEWIESEERRLRQQEPPPEAQLDVQLPPAPAAEPRAEPEPVAEPEPPQPAEVEVTDQPEEEPARGADAPAVSIPATPAHAGMEVERPVRTPLPAVAAARYSVPVTSPTRERLTRAAAVLILAYWTYYIGWRWAATLNPEALWFSVPLALAETWGLLTAFFLVFTTWKLNHRQPAPPPPGLSVDVFVTTYDEPLEVVRRTAISAREISYPHRTYVLDDGRREEIRAMAEELGVGYIRRENNEHAKAGNLNHALQYTSGELILQLDADHAPLPHMLDRLLGFFDDPKVAFVQTPQDFYNTDSFTSDVNEADQRIWEEQHLFFAVMQPGKDATNSAFFCGSCAVIRRSALEEIGGFSTHSITEDIETSLRLHARGWKSFYYGESMAYGLAAGSAEAFHTQHFRWAQGAMQVLRRFNPLTYPGLTLAQRIGYFYSLSAYTVGVQKLIFYLAPIVFFLTGMLPIRSLDREFLVRFVPYLVLSIVLVEMLSRGLGFTWIAERYQMAKFWTYARALPTFFTRRPLRFKVTPKGPGRVSAASFAPHLALMVATAFAVNWATLAHHFGWVEYGVPGWSSLAFQLNFLWAVINFVLAAYVVRLSLRIQQQRQDHRFADRFPIHLRARGEHGQLGEPQIALTEDLNTSGLSFRSVHPLPTGGEVQLILPLSTGEVVVEGAVVHVRRDQQAEVPIYVHGVEFRDLPLDVRDAVELHCAQHAVPIRQMQYQRTAAVISRAQDWLRNARGEPRRRVRLPTWVLLSDGQGHADRTHEHVAFLEEISRNGARLIMNEPVPPGTHIVFEVPGTELRGEGLSVFSRALETPIGVRFAVGVRRASALTSEPSRKGTMRIRRMWRAAAAPASAVLTLLSAAPLVAQVQPVAFGTVEVDTEDQRLLLLGVSVQPEGLGWQPVAGLLGYRLTFPTATQTSTINAVSPSVGLRHQWPVGAFQASVGYLFLNEEISGGFGAPGGTSQGVTTSFMADYWGSGARSAQALVTFNWAESYLWTRARFAQRIASIPAGAVRVGLEGVVQGGGDAPGDDFRALQGGPLVEVDVTRALRLIGSAGIKTDNLSVPDRPEAFPYFKVEFVLVP